MVDPSELRSAVEALLRSYEEHGNINHIDEANLPSRDEVAALLDELIMLIFPGYFAAAHLDALGAPFVVGERCVSLLATLKGAIARALAHAQAEEGPEGKGPRRAGHVPTEFEVAAEGLALGTLEALPAIRGVLALDLKAALAGDPAARSAAEVITSYPGMLAVAAHRVAHHLWNAGVPLIARMISELVHGRTGIDIHPAASIGAGFFIDHGTGVVIGETCIIGEKVKLYQGVTLGAHSLRDPSAGKGKKRHPTLQEGVTVYAGATILGGDTVIGAGSTVGGNVWLTHSVPRGTTVTLDRPSLRMLTPAAPEADTDPVALPRA